MSAIAGLFSYGAGLVCGIVAAAVIGSVGFNGGELELSMIVGAAIGLIAGLCTWRFAMDPHREPRIKPLGSILAGLAGGATPVLVIYLALYSQCSSGGCQ